MCQNKVPVVVPYYATDYTVATYHDLDLQTPAADSFAGED